MGVKGGKMISTFLNFQWLILYAVHSPVFLARHRSATLTPAPVKTKLVSTASAVYDAGSRFVVPKQTRSSAGANLNATYLL